MVSPIPPLKIDSYHRNCVSYDLYVFEMPRHDFIYCSWCWKEINEGECFHSLRDNYSTYICEPCYQLELWKCDGCEITFDCDRPSKDDKGRLWCQQCRKIREK